MNLSISYNNKSYSVDIEPTESNVWEEISKNLLDVSVPGEIHVSSDNGNAELKITKRGKYVKNGIEMPSMYVTVANHICCLASSTYKEAYLTCINTESNNYKFYHLRPSVNGINVTYGRIGSDRGEAFGTRDVQVPYESYLYWVRYYEKLSKGYIDQTEVYLSPIAKKKPAPVKKEKKVEEEPENKIALMLYNQLKAYAKNLVQKTFVNSSNITKKQIQKSKYFLSQMGERKTVNGFNNQLKQLLMVCPRKARDIRVLLANSTADFAGIILREENLVAAMQVVSDDNNEVVLDDSESFKNFGVNVFNATDKQKEEVMSHLSSNLQSHVKNIYRVINKNQKDNFDNYLKQNDIKKVKCLWHGSRNENWLSIILNGLQLNPNARITGKMFGKGIYFAPSSEKSWGYTSYYGTRWAGGKCGTAYMGLYATAYGNPLDVTCSGDYNQNILVSKNKNCVHAHAGQYLYNDEIIYYSESAMTLNYIVEFN